MKVILLRDINSVGSAGEIVSVASGYARNFLIPKRQALLATDANVAQFESQRRQHEAVAERDKRSTEAQAVELEVDHRVLLGQFVQELVVEGDAHAVGVDHDLAYAPVPGGLDHLHQVRVNGGLAAAELDDLGVTLSLHEAVKHELHLLHRQAEADPCIGETDGAVQVAGRVDLDQGQAYVSFVLRA